MYRMNWRYGRDVRDELEVWERCTGSTGGMGDVELCPPPTKGLHNQSLPPTHTLITSRENPRIFCSNNNSLTIVFSHH